MSGGPKNINQWLGFALSAPDKKKGNGEPAMCIGFTVNHVQGGVDREIHAVNVGGKKFTDAMVVELGQTLYGIAETDCQNLTGTQQYVIYALYEEQPAGKPTARYPLRINGHIVNASGDLSTEAPTDEGRRAQRMRHDEGYSQILTTATANLINMQTAFMKVQNDALVNKARENMDLTEAVNKMLLDKITSDREHELRLLEHQRNSQLIAGITKIAPALLNQVTGREIIPQSAADTAILEAVADALDEKTMGELMPFLAKLPPAAQGILMSRLQQITEAKKTAEDRVDRSLAKMDPNSLAEAELGDFREKH